MPTTASTASEPIMLKGGVVVSLEALRLLWDFENRGCIVRQGRMANYRLGHVT